MRTQYLKKWRAWLTVFILICCATNVHAGHKRMSSSQISIEKGFSKDGCITVRLPFYDDGGGRGAGEQDEGLLKDSKITFNGTTLLNLYSFVKKGKPQDSGNKYWVIIDGQEFKPWCDKIEVIGNSTKTITEENTSSDKIYSWQNGRDVSYITIKFYFNPKALMSGGTLAVGLKVDINNIDSDYNLDRSLDITPLDFPTPKIEDMMNPNEQGKWNIKADVRTYPYKDQISILCNGELKVNGKDNVTWDEDIKGKSKNLGIYARYKLRDDCIINSSVQDLTIKGYDYVNTLDVRQIKNGRVRLAWTTFGNYNSIETGGFVITRILKDGTSKDIPVNNPDQREYIDEEAMNYVTEDIRYIVRRQKPYNWTTYKAQEKTIKINNKHVTVTDFTSVKLLPQRAAELTWKWNYGIDSTYVLTKNSKIILIRRKSVDGNTFIEDKKTEIYAKEFLEGGKYYNKKDSSVCNYTETFEQSCVLYTWEISVLPGHSNFTQQNAVKVTEYLQPMRNEKGEAIHDEEGNVIYTATDSKGNRYVGINDVTMAEVDKFKASHGYFGDRVELAWTLSKDGGSIDVFSVQRREMDEKVENKFVQIATVEGIAGILNYAYTDTKAVPGKVYEYLIEGTKECADQEIKTKNYAYGFCTATGNVYGRLTFVSENGQAVNGAEVRLETKADIIGRSYRFDGNYHLTVDNDSLFRGHDADSLTFQMFAKFEGSHESKKQILLQHGENFSVYALDDVIHFQMAGTDLAAKEKISELTKESSFMQITAVSSADSLCIYINNVYMGSTAISNTGNTITDGQLTMGKDFHGCLDEVRIWSKDFSAEDVKNTFDRYIAGDEEGIMAYWNFNFSTKKEFYDAAHKDGNYFMNDGKIVNKDGEFVEAVMSSYAGDNPSSNQLGYKDYTNTDGSYYIAGVPYIGNGTLYTIIPRLGTHEFSPTKIQVTISSGSVNHSANFIDKSAFPVSGTIRFMGSTIPVEGVQFYVDGIVCSDDKGNLVQTDADGKFKIYVPVGVHEVRAKKANHKFKNEGRLLDDYGHDINYQDDRYSTVELWDVTKVKLIGRVAGGAIQEELPVGHSLSVNNLGDGISVQLTYENPAYQLTTSESDVTETMTHFLPGNWEDNGKTANENKVIFRGKSNVVNIIPNKETGEFVAELLPISYAVKVNAPAAYTNISGNNSKLDLSNVFAVQTETHEYTEYIDENNKKVEKTYSDTVEYNQKQLFIARVKPIVNVEQMNGSQPLKYFGSATTELQTMGKAKQIKLYDEESGMYLLGLPVFKQCDTYKLKASVYEEYKYYDEQGDVVPDKVTDKVPSQDAMVNFQTTMGSSNDSEDVEADEAGVAYWSFKVNKVDITSASANINIRAKVGKEENATSFAWTSPFDENNLVITTGRVSQGNDFVTAGPDKILAVLRDPPGSNSYSYLEKGVTFTESTQYSGTATQEGSEDIITENGTELITFTGVGAGTVEKSVVATSGVQMNIEHSESWTNSDTKTSTTTINSGFQTSDDPDYVGEMGDTFLGYSTNLSIGRSECVTLITTERYNANKDAYTPLGFADEKGEMMLVRTNALAVGTTFDTFFAYPLVHIESMLIPQLYELRNSFLHPKGEMSDTEFKAEANKSKRPVYVSNLDSENPNYGRSNTDKIFKDDPKYHTKAGADVFDGPSYKIYFPDNYTNKTDTINFIMQSIKNWENRLRDNEKAKVDAIANGEVLQNYSFQAGSSIEYSKEYANSEEHSESWEIVFSMGISNDTEVACLGQGVTMEFAEKVGLTKGKETSNGNEANVNVGFVLADNGNDYLTVDVYQEKGGMNKDISDEKVDSLGLNLSTFIFRTRAGATSCPYEDEVKTRYYEPGKHILSEATLPIEVPVISVENASINNVPSGEPAYVKLFLRNNSAVKSDAWYNLIIDDKANELGAKLKMDGGAISNGRTVLVPAGETITKILEVTKGPGMDYDDIKLVLASQCQGDPTANFPIVADTVSFSVHFTPSCSDIDVVAPSDNWVYNTEMPVQNMKDGTTQHYMPVKMSNFNVNYDNFKCIRLMYKPSSDSDENWITLMNYFTNDSLYEDAKKNGMNAQMIKKTDNGTLTYKWFLDKMPDQKYDLCAVTVCDIDNVEVLNFSETHSGVKDMYRPRLFGSPQPSNGILTINDEAMIRFNETIAAGYLTQNNFEVTGIKNGSKTTHSVAVEVDGNDKFKSELERSLRGKDFTFETWINVPENQDATIFEHGSGNEKLTFGITKERKLTATINNKVYESEAAEDKDYTDNWNHVALVLEQAEDGNATGKLTLYFNFVAMLEIDDVPAYTQKSAYTMARGLVGKIHDMRLWTAPRSSGELQLGSNITLSGNEANLLSYYPMNEARGNVLKDKARGLNLAMTGGKWIIPEGRALSLTGPNNYLKIVSDSSIVVDKETDYTIELWFNGNDVNNDAALLASGTGDGTDLGGSENLFFLGFDNGDLVYRNNGNTLKAKGSYLDGNWHHVAVSANRITQRIQMYVDGYLNTYAEEAEAGQIAAPYTYVGTTPVRVDNTKTVFSDYFIGSIDDVRFWNMYKNEKSVAAGMSDRLDGSEMGLLSYLPFEKHGVTEANIPVVRFSLEDAKIPEGAAPRNKDVIAVKDDVEYEEINADNRLVLEDRFMTAAIAPVKDAGAAEDLLFDYVVNNDALIVTLKEEPAKIDKTTVNITVSDIRDLNGNKTASPITWTIYIDRNQLKWSEDEINLVKNVNEPLEFTVDVVNNGGFTEDYTISNYPSWMYVEPNYGTLTATQNEHIKFTVDESVNIGTYNEVIYLTNADGVTEALNINLKVNGEKPDWNVNPADYKYTMNVYGQLEINNKFSNDLEDMLAAFENNVCVGVANTQYIRANDMYYVLLTVYSNSAKHDDLKFKMWDASTGTTYVAAPDNDIRFVADSIIGSPKNPEIFRNLNLVQLDIRLNEGWTWTSFNVENSDMKNITELLKYNQWKNGDEIKREDGGVATYGNDDGWKGTLTSFDNKGMFMIRSSAEQTLSVIGSVVDPAENILTINCVNEKGQPVWNYIPYLAQSNLRLNEALAGYEAIEGDVIKSQSAFAMYNNSLGWIGSLEYMQPGRGYMMQRIGTEAATLQYPTEATQSDYSAKMMMNEANDINADLGYLNNQYAKTMSVVATVNGVEAVEGDILKFYINGELRGKSPVICRNEQGRALFYASVAGDKNESIDVVIERNGEDVAGIAAWALFEADRVRGSYSAPEEINFEGVSKTVYPSPFNEELFIESEVDPNADVVVTITNMHGAYVASFTDCNYNGKVYIHWTGASKCTRGVYLVNICVDGKDNVHKVIKII